MGNLSGKYAIVTGGGKGIGAAIVKRFLDDGIAGVGLLEIDGSLAEKTAKLLDPSGKRIETIVCNVADEESVKKAVKQFVDRFGTVDILINNAGITRDAMFHKMTREQWDAVMNVNLYGPYLMCKEAFPIMREKGYGRIVNISSTSALGNAGQANYAATKAALMGFTKTLAKEGGPKNITANCIAPGFIETDMYIAVPEAAKAEQKKKIALQRLGRPDEIASVASFLASDDASFLSSQCIFVSGGSTTG